MDDLRCCGSGACIIDAEGNCWCGQQWDGKKMCSKLSKEAVDNQPDEHLPSPSTKPDLAQPN